MPSNFQFLKRVGFDQFMLKMVQLTNSGMADMHFIYGMAQRQRFKEHTFINTHDFVKKTVLKGTQP